MAKGGSRRTALPDGGAQGSTGFFEELRLSYRPQKVAVLFVAESRPAGGTFFYAGNSRLAEYTRQAFSFDYDIPAMTMAEFLFGFRAAGCYLEDLCPEPVNHIKSSSLRRNVWKQSVKYLAGRIEQASPAVILPIHKSSELFIKEAVLMAGYSGLLRPAIPFPSMGNQPRYIRELTLAIDELRMAGFLPEKFGV